MLVNADAPELRLVHRWLDSWAGIGLIVVGMAHQRFYIGLGQHSAGRWVALFYRGSGGHELVTAAGTAYESMAWRTVQRAARAATEAGALQRRVALVTGAVALSNHYDHISGSLGLHVRPFAGVSFAPHTAKNCVSGRPAGDLERVPGAVVTKPPEYSRAARNSSTALSVVIND